MQVELILPLDYDRQSYKKITPGLPIILRNIIFNNLLNSFLSKFYL